MDYEGRFLNPCPKEDLVYLLRKIHIAAENCPDGYSLASGSPHPNTVPIRKSTFLCEDGTSIEITEDEMREGLQYQSAEGMKRLLEWIKVIHTKYHNPPILNHENESSRFDSCVTSGGAMGAMHLLFSQIIQNNDVVLTDEYIFGGTICCFKRAGAIMLGVEMDDKGIIPESLKDCLENWQAKVIELGVDSKLDLKAPKLVYTIPTGQNPTGVVVPIERKKEIYKIAKEYDLLIISDDPYFYIQYEKHLVPSYQSIDTDGRVLRIDSMSKFIAPGTRLGWISGPSAITQRIADAQTTCAVAAGSLSQLVTIKLFDKWGMSGIVKRIEYLQNFYESARNEAVKGAEKYLAELAEWNQPEAGFFLWMKLKSGKDTLFLADTEIAQKYGAFAVPGIDFSCSSKNGPYLRIAFSYISKDKLQELGAIKLFDQWGEDGIAYRIKYLRDFYKPARDETQKHAETYLSGLSRIAEWTKPEAGFFLWMKLKSGKDTLFLADTEVAQKYGAFAVPGVDFSCFRKDGPYIRVAFSSIPRSKMEKAVKRLAKFFEEGTIKGKTEATNEYVELMPSNEIMEKAPKTKTVEEASKTETVEETPITEIIEEAPKTEKTEAATKNETTDEATKSEKAVELPKREKAGKKASKSVISESKKADRKASKANVVS